MQLVKQREEQELLKIINKVPLGKILLILLSNAEKLLFVLLVTYGWSMIQINYNIELVFNNLEVMF